MNILRVNHFNFIHLIIWSVFLICACDKNNTSIEPDNVDTTSVNFTDSGQSLGNTRSFGVALADVDMDNDIDIFITNYIGPSRLWLNNGQGIFTESGQNFSPTDAHDVDIADLNGDSFPDIFIVNHNVQSKVFFNDGTGHFTDSGQLIGSASSHPGTIQLCDVDGDHDVDALIYTIDAPNRIWLNGGNGNFIKTNIDYGGTGSNRLKLGDFNGDSYPDLFISLRTQPNQVWMNDGSGNYTNSEQSLGGSTDFIDCQDIDGDGDIDIIEASGNEMRTWLNFNNTGTFTAGTIIDEGALICSFFDADLDGDNDLVTAHISNGNKLWLNDGSGLFTSLGSMFGTTRVLSIACGKLNSDDDNDVLFGKLEGTGGNLIYFNEE